MKKVKKIRAGFAMNLRKRGAEPFRAGSPHNNVAQGMLKFYTKYDSREDLVWKIKRQTDGIKLSPSPVVQQKIALGIAHILPRSLSTKLFLDFHGTTTALLSNVAGPRVAAEIMGAKITDMVSQFPPFRP